MLNIISHQRNANQNHNEIPLDIHQNGYYFQKWKITRTGKDVETLELLYIAGRNVKWFSAMENNLYT